MNGGSSLRHRMLNTMGVLAVMTASLVGLGTAVGSSSAGAATKSPVLIADLCSCTGPEASTISQTTAIMQAWASYVNSKGGLAGHPVQLIVKDDDYNPGQAISNAQAVIAQHVAAIFDNSDEDPSFAPYVAAAGIPVLGGQETDSGWQNADFYPAGGTFNYTSSNLSITEKKYGIKKLATMYCSEVAICKESTLQGTKVGLHYGITTVYSVAINFAAPSYTAECLAAKQAGATALTVGDASAVVTKVTQDCATQGYTPKQFSSDGTVAIEWLSVPAFNGNVDTQSDIPWFVKNSATAPMYTALAKYAPSVPTGPNFGEVAIQSWADGALLQAAVAAKPPINGTVTPAEIKTGLYNLPPNTTLGGITPSPLHFVRGKPANNSCVDLMGISGGKFVVLNGGKPICAPLVKAGTLPTNS